MATVSVLALLGAPSPSYAATSYTFNINTYDGDGYAHADGTVTFTGAKAASISLNIADKCGAGSGDGDGAYAWAELGYFDGTQDVGRHWNIGFDDNGCGATTIHFNSPFNNWPKRISWIRIYLVESNGPSGAIDEHVYSTAKDNPYV